MRTVKLFFLVLFFITNAFADNADFSKPSLLSSKSNFPGEIRATVDSAACMDYTSDTNLPSLVSGTVGPIRYNRSTKKFQEYLSSSWGDKEITGLADGAVSTTAKITDGTVTLAKMANIATDRLIGRDTASTGVPEALTVSGGLEFTGSTGIQRSALTGDVTASAGSNTTAIASSIKDGNARTDLALVSQDQDGTFVWGGTSGGSANAQTLTLIPAITAYASGQTFRFTAGSTNTASATMNVSSVGAISMIRTDGNFLSPGDVTTGKTYTIVYQGTYFVVLNITPQWNTWSPTIGTVTGSLSSTSTSAKYIVGLGQTVSFSLQITTTLSGGASNVIHFTLPVTAANTDGAVHGRGNAVMAPVGIYGYFNSTTQIYMQTSDTGIAFGNGTNTLYISGTYQGA